MSKNETLKHSKQLRDPPALITLINLSVCCCKSGLRGHLAPGAET